MQPGEQVRGTIPAHAGEPGRWARRRNTAGDYPRARGGTSPASGSSSPWPGLSPRTRGNLRAAHHGGAQCGTIPAHAGEPGLLDGTIAPSRDYPRARGGTAMHVQGYDYGEGLSPRTRGNRDGDADGQGIHGTIPAHAGEPPEDERSRAGPRDYPRARGGTVCGHARTSGIPGLSPRTRGNHDQRALHRHYRGTIPAHAGEPASATASVWASRDYPRARGGTATAITLPRKSVGLSPRTRGNRSEGARRPQPGGTIPAHAGEPSPREGARPSRGDYPRARGGTDQARAGLDDAKGLSPRTRGNRVEVLQFVEDFGTIPAHAGEPSDGRAAPSSKGDYPRARGGTYRMSGFDAIGPGLSPRTRGNPSLSGGQLLRLGTIPAHAGEPGWSMRMSPARRDYPRARGGTQSINLATSYNSGLSPRTRGNRVEPSRRIALSRTIPAHAGEPATRAPRPPASRDYPRARGGTLGAVALGGGLAGLSPRTRGNPRGGGGEGRLLGTIPAHAGEPCRAGSSSPSCWDYPRARGGTLRETADKVIDPGLSPRTRGNLLGSALHLPDIGTIPAHAGEPATCQAAGSISQDYPRARGGTVPSGPNRHSIAGLSPRTRGNRS